jgi:hypothetical protein
MSSPAVVHRHEEDPPCEPLVPVWGETDERGRDEGRVWGMASWRLLTAATVMMVLLLSAFLCEECLLIIVLVCACFAGSRIEMLVIFAAGVMLLLVRHWALVRSAYHTREWLAQAPPLDFH